MKALAIWLVAFGIMFGGFWGSTHLFRESHPDRVLVVVDSSYAMQGVWSKIPGVLGGLDDRQYAEFALATEKGPIHDWSARLSLGSVVAFAPCDLGRIGSLEVLDEADEVVFVTTSGSCPTDILPGEWRVVVVD